MNVKQRFSVAVSTVLPALALVGYLSIAPAKAQVISSCPAGEILSPPPFPLKGCGSGTGGDLFIGETSIVVTCPGTPPGTGEGTCESESCVKCVD
jgi:hypothetical protein